jgi:hypothetical protein
MRDDLGLEHVNGILAGKGAFLESIVLVVAVLAESVESTSVLLEDLAHVLVGDLGLLESLGGDVHTVLGAGDGDLERGEVDGSELALKTKRVDVVDIVVGGVGETLEGDEALLVGGELGGNVGEKAERVGVVAGGGHESLVTEETLDDGEDVGNNGVIVLDHLVVSSLNGRGNSLGSGGRHVESEINLSRGGNISLGLKERKEETLILNLSRSELNRNGRMIREGEVRVELLDHVERTLNGLHATLEVNALLPAEACKILPSLNTNITVMVESTTSKIHNTITVPGVPLMGHVLALNTGLEKFHDVLRFADVLHGMKDDISTLVSALVDIPFTIVLLSLTKADSRTMGKLLYDEWYAYVVVES